MVLPYSERADVPPCCVIPAINCPPWYRFSDVPYERHPMDYYEVFLRGKPKLIGILQIAVGIFQIGMGISSVAVLPFNISSYTVYNIWGPLCLITTGSLTFYGGGAKRTFKYLITTGSLTFYGGGAKRTFKYIEFVFALNICNIALCVAGTTLNSLDVNRPYSYYTYGNMQSSNVVVCFLIITNIVQLIVTIPVLVFGYQSLKCYEISDPQVFVIPNDVPPLLPPPPYSAEPTFFNGAPPSYTDNIN